MTIDLFGRYALLTIRFCILMTKFLLLKIIFLVVLENTFQDPLYWLDHHICVCVHACEQTFHIRLLEHTYSYFTLFIHKGICVTTWAIHSYKHIYTLYIFITYLCIHIHVHRSQTWELCYQGTHMQCMDKVLYPWPNW